MFSPELCERRQGSGIFRGFSGHPGQESVFAAVQGRDRTLRSPALLVETLARRTVSGPTSLCVCSFLAWTSDGLYGSYKRCASSSCHHLLSPFPPPVFWPLVSSLLAISLILHQSAVVEGLQKECQEECKVLSSYRWGQWKKSAGCPVCAVSVFSEVTMSLLKSCHPMSSCCQSSAMMFLYLVRCITSFLDLHCKSLTCKWDCWAFHVDNCPGATPPNAVINWGFWGCGRMGDIRKIIRHHRCNKWSCNTSSVIAQLTAHISKMDLPPYRCFCVTPPLLLFWFPLLLVSLTCLPCSSPCPSLSISLYIYLY